MTNKNYFEVLAEKGKLALEQDLKDVKVQIEAYKERFEREVARAKEQSFDTGKAELFRKVLKNYQDFQSEIEYELNEIEYVDNGLRVVKK